MTALLRFGAPMSNAILESYTFTINNYKTTMNEIKPKQTVTSLPDSHDPANTARWVDAVADYLYILGCYTPKQQNRDWDQAVECINRRSDITIPSNPVGYLRILVRERINEYYVDARRGKTRVHTVKHV